MLFARDTRAYYRFNTSTTPWGSLVEALPSLEDVTDLRLTYFSSRQVAGMSLAGRFPLSINTLVSLSRSCLRRAVHQGRATKGPQILCVQYQSSGLEGRFNMKLLLGSLFLLQDQAEGTSLVASHGSHPVVLMF